MKPFYSSKWIPNKNLLKTRLKGKITMQDAIEWQKNLNDISLKIDRPFKLFFDNYGYEFEDIGVHKAWREFVPRLLAKHGLLMSLLGEHDRLQLMDAKDETKPICYGLALIHQDEYKMQTLNNDFGNKHQKYFSQIKPAIRWINNINVD